MIDCHVHLAALPDGHNGCYISPRMLKSPLFRFLLWKHGYDCTDPARANRKYIEDLRTEIRDSQYVGKSVLLAIDGVYDAGGRLDAGRTEFLISNDYVMDAVREFPEAFLGGVSINPSRRDALDEIDRCAAAGAVLVKVLPNAQGFDPSNRAFLPFYRRLAQHRLSLLSHVGYEFSLIGHDQSMGDPAKLRLPLDEGVTVIAAHGCSNGLFVYEPYYATLAQLIRQYPHFYTDLSALTLPNRFRMLLLLRHRADLSSRFLFGTDYPLSVFHLPCWGRVGWRDLRHIRATTNRFDRQYLVLRSLGIPVQSFGAWAAGEEG